MGPNELIKSVGGLLWGPGGPIIGLSALIWVQVTIYYVYLYLYVWDLSGPQQDLNALIWGLGGLIWALGGLIWALARQT